MIRTRSASLALVLFAALLAFAGTCRNNPTVVPIKSLLDDPTRYDRQIVRVTGTVSGSAGVFGYGTYVVDDGTGTIRVVSRGGGAPRDGARVGVEGEFRSVYTLGDQSAAVILERSRFGPP
jgi:hypothetical protein